MSGAMASAVLVVMSAASPPFACKGADTLLRDDFTDEDPAWNVPADGSASGSACGPARPWLLPEGSEAPPQ
jgi:hypothetical protein